MLRLLLSPLQRFFHVLLNSASLQPAQLLTTLQIGL
jgi:hypothetical protein